MDERLWSKVDASGDCWLWTSSTNGWGYGQFAMERPDGSRTMKGAHRVIWEFLVGPLPEGMQLDHLCRVRRCVNPDHLQVVSQRTNLLRGYGLPGMEARQIACRYGHPFSALNSYRDVRGKRVCRACARRKVYAQRLMGIRYDRRKDN